MRMRKAWVALILALAVVTTLGVACDGDGGGGEGDGGDAGNTESRTDSFDVGESATLNVSSENGRIEVEAGPAGTISVRATLRDAPRVRYEAGQDGGTVTIEADVEAGGGDAGADIEVVAPRDTIVMLESSNGAIKVEGIESTGVLRTSNGRVVLSNVQGHYSALTSNGGIEVESLEGTAELTTSNGSVEVEGATGSFRVTTSNSSISFSGELVSGGENRFETSNGSVEVRLQGTPSVRLDVSAGEGAIENSLPIDATLTEPGRLEGVIGDGAAELVIRTSNGTVNIR